MPNPYLVYTVAGKEVSSTDEGRHVSLPESYMIHPYHSDGLVDGKDPVLVGDNIVGVAFSSAAANTDVIAFDTEGIWALNVLGSISDGSVDGAAWALAAGDPVYINRTAGTVGAPYMLSGQDDPHNFVPFGYLLTPVAADKLVPTVASVKVHGAPNFLESINVGAYSTPAGPVVTDMLLVDTSAAKRAVKEAGESWGLEYAWLTAYVGLSDPLAVNEDMHGLYVRLEDDKHTTGGDLFAGRFQTHCNHVHGDWTRLYGLYVAISNQASLTIGESIGIAIAMGGPGAAPTVQTAIQIMGDGTLSAARQSWFQTEIGRGAGLEAQNTNVVAKTHQIPIDIDGTIYAIPVIPWI